MEHRRFMTLFSVIWLGLDPDSTLVFLQCLNNPRGD